MDELHADCRRRLESNPLRLLDCKEDSCQPIIAGAPHSVDHLCGACQEHRSALQTYLVESGLPYEIDHRLVRGFDYYTRTVFEIVPPVEGRQATVLGGGRYDGLIQELGGKTTPGVGFGMGIERVIENMKRQGAGPPDRVSTRILVAHVGDTAKVEAMRLCARLRQEGTSRGSGAFREGSPEPAPLRLLHQGDPRSDYRGGRDRKGRGNAAGPGRKQAGADHPERAARALRRPYLTVVLTGARLTFSPAESQLVLLSADHGDVPLASTGELSASSAMRMGMVPSGSIVSF